MQAECCLLSRLKQPRGSNSANWQVTCVRLLVRHARQPSQHLRSNLPGQHVRQGCLIRPSYQARKQQGPRLFLTAQLREL